MKHIFDYCKHIHINEYLNTKDIKEDPDKIRNNKRTDAPSTWEVGDILCGCYHYSVTLPYFYKIIKKSNVQFTLQRMEEKLVSGHYNGQYEVIADDKEDEKEKPIKVRVNKYGRVQVGSGWGAVILRLWDGKTPLKGNDLD